ncbi:MAG: CoA pyrophosphatase [Pseudomonadota bacterium]|nr:CoA pyrophosphatase [Pseudomonadota bacterium]
MTKQRVRRNLLEKEPAPLAMCRGHAAVAFVISDVNSPSLTLCVKAPHLRKHAGEVSLPGGKVELSDSSVMSAALRELKEETGLILTAQHSLGYLNPIESLYQLSVIPCVFWSDGLLIGEPREQEIARVFSMPIEEFLSQPPTFEVSQHRSPALWTPRWRYNNEEIWGLTALIVRDFFQTISADRMILNRPSMP